MIPQQNFENYPVFGDDATKIQPGAAKYAAGFQESDVLPAEWMNWAWNKNSKGITDLNAAAASMEAELGNVVTQAGLTPAANDNTQVMQAIRNFFTGNLSTIYITTAANVTPAAENVGTITALTDGLSITVMLKNGYYGDGTNPMRFNLNNLGLKKIYAVKDGAPIIMPSHTIDRGDGNGSKPWYCQPYTTLKLTFDASLEEGDGAWVITQDVVVIDYKWDSPGGFEIKASGLVTNNKIPVLLKQLNSGSAYVDASGYTYLLLVLTNLANDILVSTIAQNATLITHSLSCVYPGDTTYNGNYNLSNKTLTVNFGKILLYGIK